MYAWPSFGLPVGSVIDGVEIVVEGQAVTGNQGVRIGFNPNNGGLWITENSADLTTAGDTEVTEGGPTDKWGLTLNVSDFNAGNVRVRLQNRDNNANSLAIDHVKVKVYYTEPPEEEQEGFRWRDDDDSESAAAFLAAQDAHITRAKNTNTRLRVLIDAVHDPTTTPYQLEFRKKGSGDNWRAVEVL